MNKRKYSPGFDSQSGSSLAFNFNSRNQTSGISNRQPQGGKIDENLLKRPRLDAQHISNLDTQKISFKMPPNKNNAVKQQPGSGTRYFDKLITKMKENSSDLPSTSSTSRTQNTGIKRRFLDTQAAPDFISLDSNQSYSKRVKRWSESDSDNDVITEDNNNNTINTNSFGTEPYTSKEARRLFISDSFSEQIHQFYLKHRQQESFLQKKQQLRSALEKAINRTTAHGSSLLLVGSSINGFGRITSDADFCLIIDRHQENITNRKRIMRTLYELDHLLRKAPFARKMQVIPAKVPILKFVDAYSGMECDVNVNNLTGIRNTELLKRYATLDPRVQPLSLIIKEWAHQRNINDASQGTLNSYSLVLMVVHFLQCGVSPPVLPSLQVKHPDSFKRSIPIMAVTHCGEKIKPFRSQNKSTLSELLRRFFEYYAVKFNFNRHVMSVRLGSVFDVDEIIRPAKEWTRSIKIEEPFDLTNTARAVYSDQIARKIFREFSSAHGILKRGKGLDSLLNNASPIHGFDDSIIVLDD